MNESLVFFMIIADYSLPGCRGVEEYSSRDEESEQEEYGRGHEQRERTTRDDDRGSE